jgi:DNA-binding FadR family transcriptional regulator
MTKMGAAITLERSQYPDRSLHDRVVHAIGRKVLGGELPPGALLPAEPELGASRTVLREAIKVLTAKGLLVSFRATSRLPGRASGSLPKHRAIFDAIRARDPGDAAAAMRHLVQATAREIETMGRRPRPCRRGASRLGR